MTEAVFIWKNISVNTEITDNNVAKPSGWVFYDGECALCTRGARHWGGLFARRGFCWLPLQTPGVAGRLGVTKAALLEEMKLQLADGRVLGGVGAWAVLFCSVWWLWPLGVLLDLPAIHWLGAGCYRWIARHRRCVGGRCGLHGSESPHHRHAVFFEIP